MKHNLPPSRYLLVALVLLMAAGLLPTRNRITAKSKENKLTAVRSPRLSMHLNRLISERANKPANFAIQTKDGGNLQTYIHLKDPAPQHLDALRASNVAIEQAQTGWPVIQARIPFSRIREVASYDFVQFIRLPDYAVKLTGSITSEGDEILRAAKVRLVHNADGSGVRVGVISDGVEHAADARATGDLPPSLEIDPSLPGSGDEGTAMLEIIHDLAPGAQLAFSGPRTSLDMLAAIDFLANNAFSGQGCDVLVDDLGFLAEPFFQDGAIAQKVDEVVASGVTYLTAVGNQARGHYERSFIAGSFNFGGNTLAVHDFGKAEGGVSDVSQQIRIFPNSTLTVILQWNDPYFGAGNDYDLLIFNQDLSDTLATSEELQNGQPQRSPLEIASYENTTTQFLPVNIVVRNFNSAAPRLLEMHYVGSGFSVDQFNVAEGSVVPGQQSAKGAISVGAINVNDFGHDDIESFSSLGPVRVFFPQVEERTKPEVTAVDGNRITGAGGFGSAGRFFGTSAAAPHAAAVAALLLEGNPNLSPASVRQALQSTAVDLGSPGEDNTYGHGRIDAFQAFTAIVAAVAEKEENGGPKGFSLLQNYPNPFNPATTVRYVLPDDLGEVPVKLSIYNQLGQIVNVLVDRNQAAGEYEVEWDGSNLKGKAAASGLYVYRLEAGTSVEIRKMLLLR